MRPSEWLNILGVIADRWPHSEIPEATAEQWGSDLADLDAEHVAIAVEVLYREGVRFAPNGAQVRRKVIELTLDAPEWTQVLNELHGRGDGSVLPEVCKGGDPCELGGVGGWVVADDDVAYPCECLSRRHGAVERRKAERHPLVAKFVAYVGDDQVAEGLEGGNAEARLRVKWEQFTERTHREVAVQGLPSGGLPALERINREAPRTMAEIVGEARKALERAA